jgi:hypothetical protein
LVRLGEVVAIFITTPVAGAVGVHGLTDIRPILAGSSLNLRFKAVVEGRYALHFHGIDGSHFELVAVEVEPKN